MVDRATNHSFVDCDLHTLALHWRGVLSGLDRLAGEWLQGRVDWRGNCVRAGSSGRGVVSGPWSGHRAGSAGGGFISGPGRMDD